jgi:hypothetical protein
VDSLEEPRPTDRPGLIIHYNDRCGASAKGSRYLGVRKGLSLREIASQTGFTVGSVRWTLKSGGVVMRSATPVPFSAWEKSHGTISSRPPYGYCFLQGEVVKDTSEFKTLLLIHRLWKSGATAYSVAKQLNGMRVPPRRGKLWGWKSINNILKRLKQKLYDQEVFQ